MNKLGDKHLEFLRKAAKDNGHTHEAVGIDKEDLDLMVREGLLIEYVGPTTRYAVTNIGGQFARTLGDTAEMVKIAVNVAMSKGYDEAGAKELVAKYGAEYILKAKAAEERGDATGQREVSVPSTRDGAHEIVFKKSF